MMIRPCCYCGIPLHRAAQYVGIAEVILGLLGCIGFGIHVKNLYEGRTPSLYDEHHSHLGSSSFHHDRDSNRIHIRTYSRIELLPKELVLTILICHGIQFLMGIALYFAAVNKNRSACLFWMGVTAVTVLFTTFFFLRLYEMLIVNEFIHELKMEQEVTYFPGQHPTQQQLDHYHHPQQIISQQPMCNPLAPSADSHLSVVTIPTVTPTPYNYPPTVPTEAQPQPPGNPYYYGQYPTAPGPQYQYQQIPAALQPPPYYEVAGNSNMNGNGNNISAAGYTVDSVVFPNERNEYRNTFSKF